MLQRLVDAAAVEAEIERVRSLSGAALRRTLNEMFGLFSRGTFRSDRMVSRIRVRCSDVSVTLPWRFSPWVWSPSLR
jgi:hypothetical protein